MQNRAFAFAGFKLYISAPVEQARLKGCVILSLAMKRDWKILLVTVAGALAALAGVIGLCLLPGYMMDSGRRACLRWLRSPSNREALRTEA